MLIGLFGVGGGFLIIPALVLMLGVEMPIAVGTSLIIIVANSAAALVSHIGEADIDWVITAAFAGGAIAASMIFGHVEHHRHPTSLIFNIFEEHSWT